MREGSQGKVGETCHGWGTKCEMIKNELIKNSQSKRRQEKREKEHGVSEANRKHIERQ